MSRIMITGFFTTKTEVYRNMILDHWRTLTAYAEKNEPGTLRCAAMIPYDDDDGSSIYCISEFADADAEAKHQQSEPYEKLKLLLEGKNDQPLVAPPTIYRDEVTLSNGEIYSFTRNTINDHPNAYVVFGMFHYQTGQTPAALPGWKTLIEYSNENEDLALTYTLLQDTKTDKIRTFEAYANKQFAKEVHVKGPAVKQNQEQNGELRIPGVPPTIHRGKKFAGFLGRV